MIQNSFTIITKSKAYIEKFIGTLEAREKKKLL